MVEAENPTDGQATQDLSGDTSDGVVVRINALAKDNQVLTSSLVSERHEKARLLSAVSRLQGENAALRETLAAANAMSDEVAFLASTLERHGLRLNEVGENMQAVGRNSGICRALRRLQRGRRAVAPDPDVSHLACDATDPWSRSRHQALTRSPCVTSMGIATERERMRTHSRRRQLLRDGLIVTDVDFRLPGPQLFPATPEIDRRLVMPVGDGTPQ